jgi:hypothetical protein
MSGQNIDDFYYVVSEVLVALYEVFPVRQLLLVEDLVGPIQWDMTGLPDRRSQACFETLVWLSAHDLLSYRSVEPRSTGLEGVVLTQKAFVLLTGSVNWDSGPPTARIAALRDARAQRAYNDLETVIRDMLHANCRWHSPLEPEPLPRSSGLPEAGDAH